MKSVITRNMLMCVKSSALIKLQVHKFVVGFDVASTSLILHIKVGADSFSVVIWLRKGIWTLIGVITTNKVRPMHVQTVIEVTNHLSTILSHILDRIVPRVVLFNLNATLYFKQSVLSAF